MIRIRAAQVEALEEERQCAWALQEAEPLQELWPMRFRGAPRQEFARQVYAAVKRARGYGIRRDRLVLRFLNVAFAMGFDFDTRHREPGSILRARGIAQRVRIDQLSSWTRRRLQAGEAG